MVQNKSCLLNGEVLMKGEDSQCIITEVEICMWEMHQVKVEVGHMFETTDITHGIMLFM